ncbi:MAG: DUF4349 domain-containing protein [Deltaproteobacteria bacterium]|nr:DUF4349 domain-containing protein [Deltaproteobacteria bacterium]
MQIRILRLLCIIFVLILFGCAKEAEEPHGVMSKSALVEQEKTDSHKPLNNKHLEIKDRRIIKSGNIEFQTTSLSKTRSLINEAIRKYNGYISSEDEYTYTDRIQQHIVIRVPAEHFDFLIADITKGVKKFDRKHIEARDVTEEFLDISLRLKIKKETERRYRQILTRASTVKDILAIENQIGKIRAEIESIEGRLKYLENRVGYSTLTITFYETVSAPVGFAHKFKLGLKNGWNNFVWFLVGIVNIWPFLLLGLIGIIIINQYRKRRRIKNI